MSPQLLSLCISVRPTTHTHACARSTSLIMRPEKVPPRPELVPKFAADDRFKACCRQAEMHSCDLSLFLEFEFSSLIMRGIKFEPEPAPHTSASLFLFVVRRFRWIPQFVKSDRPKNTVGQICPAAGFNHKEKQTTVMSDVFQLHPVRWLITCLSQYLISPYYTNCPETKSPCDADLRFLVRNLAHPSCQAPSESVLSRSSIIDQLLLNGDKRREQQKDKEAIQEA